MSDQILPFRSGESTTSPFDTIRQTRPDGSEYWSARDLMPHLGYDKWQNFSKCVSEAKRAAEIAAGQGNLIDSSKVVPREGRGSITVADVELTRYGAYMVAMSCDGRKPQVAKAKTYFAVQARKAETSAPTQFAIPQTMSEALRLAADQFDRAELAEKKVAELEPKAEFYDELMDADGTYPMLAAAHILGWGRNVMMARMRRLGILQANNLPYRRYDHHFKVTPGTYTNRKTGEIVPTATTSVRPSGLEFLRKKLAAVTEPVQLELVGSDT